MQIDYWLTEAGVGKEIISMQDLMGVMKILKQYHDNTC